jgi:GH24 family phage-related lysozyme (muramidase)
MLSTLTTGAELISAARPTIQAHEGWESKVYRDTMGIPTIGVGFNLLNPNAKQLCAACGADYDALLAGTACLTETQIAYLYQQMAITVLEWMTAILPALFTYTQNRQIALLDMGYNLGPARFREFRQMISAILAGDWAHASEQALQSAWAREVGDRALQDARWLAEG